MRKLLALAVVGVLAVPAGVSLAGGGQHGKTIRTIGENTMEPNEFIKSTLRYDPGKVSIKHGREVTLKHRDRTAEPHTLTIVNKEDLPTTAEEVFECEICGEVAGRHFTSETAPPVPVVDEGEPGLDSRGDSLFVGEDEKISAPVTAAKGTTLHFLCVIHPWMQGKIRVNRG